MKELSIEDKAKRYDKVIDIAEKELDACGSQDCDAARQIFRLFPELKESEDEKIRKNLISYINISKHPMFSERERNEMLAWLEKQGEKHIDRELSYLLNRVICGFINDPNIPYSERDEVSKKIIPYVEQLEKQGKSYTKRDVDDAYLEGVTNTKNEIEKQYEANYQIRKDIATFIFNYKGDIKDRAKWMNYLGIKVSFAEKQGEKKSDDKIEPKFKVRDWIIDNNIKTPFQITGISNEKYDVISIYGTDMAFSSRKVEYFYRLWTINDAKDGDVLVDRFSKDNIIILYKGINPKLSVLAYCGWNGYNLSIKTNGLGYGNLDNTNYCPATKEQRDLLFQKIKEAGYKWDAEKLELKRISKEYPLTPDKCIKPAWSEEDEELYKKVETAINSYYAPFSRDAEEMSEWFKNLKNKVQPQPKQEWDEEDKNRFNNLIFLVECSKENDATKEGFIRFINKLKSLRPQNSWKPSEEQMAELRKYSANVVLRNLYYNLKKLK